MQLLILFCLQTDLIKHFIFSEFTGVFLYIQNYMATISQFLKFNFYIQLLLSFVSLALIIVMVPGDHCFYVYCVNVHFHRKKIHSIYTLHAYTACNHSIHKQYNTLIHTQYTCKLYTQNTHGSMDRWMDIQMDRQTDGWSNIYN